MGNKVFGHFCYWAITALTEKSVASIPFFSESWDGCSGDGVLEELEPPSLELPLEADEDDFSFGI